MGIWVNDWAAGYATSIMVQILVQEIMGYNAALTGPGPGTSEGYYAVAGCATPIDNVNRGCGVPVTKNHINVEAWISNYDPQIKEMEREYPSVAPKILGSMGYVGITAPYLPTPPQLAAFEAEGLALEHYRSWNFSWNEPSKYFSPLSEFNRSFLKPCNATRFMSSGPMKQFFEISGDAGGVVVNSTDGTYSGKCPDGYFWMPQSCRNDPSKCVAYITGGQGWGLEEMMQKSTFWNMPIATAVAADWAQYTKLPLRHNCTFFWWIPDPTFLELAPMDMIFPPYDERAQRAGDRRSGVTGSPIDKIVSQDLAILGPSVEDLVKRYTLTLDQLNAILLEQKQTSDSWFNVTCTWLKNNQDTWSNWIPDASQCFAGFGLYDETMQEFTNTRNTSNKIVCKACVSGSFSKELFDWRGLTYECVRCAKGTSQPFGAALECPQCQSGEFQPEEGSASCNQCASGSYQDELGQRACKSCPVGAVTLGARSVKLADCGCPEDYINLDSAGMNCVKCGEGMTCPLLSNMASLYNGTSEFGDEFVPQIVEGFFSTKDKPREIFKCLESVACPGGVPGSCGGNLVGTPCSECTQGSTWTGSACEECGVWRVIGWVLAIILIFAGLVLAYYLTSSKMTSKASTLFATTASFGMLVVTMQNLGLVGMITIEWPKELAGLFSICQLMLLDIDSYGFSCVAGQRAAVRYLLSALIFPVGVLWLLLCFGVSKLLRRHWDLAKVVSTMGAFLQVGFSTMSSTSMAPMMCYIHPNGQRSVLKYSGVMCGSSEHGVMLAIGVTLLVVFVMGFLVLCSYAIVQMPKWSSQKRFTLVNAFRFLVFRFRMDSWWFGLPMLVRGPLLSFPVVVATDYPPVQIVSIALCLAALMVTQMRSWPWKVPLLNVTDAVVSFCIVLLVTTSTLYLKAVVGPMAVFAELISTAMLSLIFVAITLMFVMTGSALFYRSAMGGQKEFAAFNMGSVPASKMIAKEMKMMVEKLERIEQENLEGRIGGLAVFDLKKVTGVITLLANEVAPPAEESSSFMFGRRIQSSSFDPALKKRAVSRSSASSRTSRASRASRVRQSTLSEVPKETNEVNEVDKVEEVDFKKVANKEQVIVLTTEWL